MAYSKRKESPDFYENTEPLVAPVDYVFRKKPFVYETIEDSKLGKKKKKIK